MLDTSILDSNVQLQQLITVLRSTDPHHLRYWDLLGDSNDTELLEKKCGICDSILDVHFERFYSQVPEIKELPPEYRKALIIKARAAASKLAPLPLLSLSTPIRVAHTPRPFPRTISPHLAKAKQGGNKKDKSVPSKRQQRTNVSSSSQETSSTFVLPDGIVLPTIAELVSDIQRLPGASHRTLRVLVDLPTMPPRAQLARKLGIGIDSVGTTISKLFGQLGLVTPKIVAKSEGWRQYRLTLLKEAYAVLTSQGFLSKS